MNLEILLIKAAEAVQQAQQWLSRRPCANIKTEHLLSVFSLKQEDRQQLGLLKKNNVGH